MMSVYTCRFFNEFVKNEIKNDLMKRLIINRMTGSSWCFKRFERISIIFTDVNKKYIVSEDGIRRL